MIAAYLAAEIAVPQLMPRGIVQPRLGGAEKPIPAEIDHREIAVRVAVVDKKELLLSPEPGKAANPGHVKSAVVGQFGP